MPVAIGSKRSFRALEELYLSRVRELAEELENAEAETNSSGQHEDRRDLYRLRRDLARTSDFADRIGRRLNELERAGPFEPGAVQCALEDGVDLSSDEAMMTDLEAFAETCPQQRLIQVLRAAAYASVVPVGFAAPGARMEPAVVDELKVTLAFASRAIAELGLSLQEDLVLPDDSVPPRLRATLRDALAGRSVAEVMSDGEKAERAFLPRLRAHLALELEAEIRSRPSGPEGAAPPPLERFPI
jgi:hypothetical protein